jgi:uncharacterized protein YggU (UPF0235/DUF167 family)
MGVAARAIRIVGGEASRTKRVAIDGVRPESLRARWPDLTV